jgi:hypothetical protein
MTNDQGGEFFVDFSDVWLAYNEELQRAKPVRGRGHRPEGEAGRVHRHRRALGLRQVHFMKLPPA